MRWGSCASAAASTSRGQPASWRISAISDGSESLSSGASRERRVGQIVLGKLLGGVPHDRGGAGVGVLHIEDRVVLRLLGDLGEVEIERLVVPPRQHDEAKDVLADLVDDFAQGDERPGALRHAHRHALVEQIHQLADLDVERSGAVGQRLHRRLHALDIAAVIGAPDVDHLVEAAPHLVAMIGDVGREIGPGAVRFLERPVDFVAEAKWRGTRSAGAAPNRPAACPLGGSSTPV